VTGPEPNEDFTAWFAAAFFRDFFQTLNLIEGEALERQAELCRHAGADFCEERSGCFCSGRPVSPPPNSPPPAVRR